MLAKSILSRFQWVQHCNSVRSTSLIHTHTTRARIAELSLTRRRLEDLECDITTTLCPVYRLERDYHQRPCLEAIPAAIQEVIQGVILEATLGAILRVILGAILGAILEVTQDMGQVRGMEIAIRANRVDRQVDRI
jgi:hypothetical protein